VPKIAACIVTAGSRLVTHQQELWDTCELCCAACQAMIAVCTTYGMHCTQAHLHGTLQEAIVLVGLP
jgi:hypothetical protein